MECVDQFGPYKNKRTGEIGLRLNLKVPETARAAELSINCSRPSKVA